MVITQKKPNKPIVLQSQQITRSSINVVSHITYSSVVNLFKTAS